MDASAGMNPTTESEAANLVSLSEQNKEDVKLPSPEDIFLQKMMSNVSQNMDLPGKLHFDPVADIQELERQQSIMRVSEGRKKSLAAPDKNNVSESLTQNHGSEQSLKKPVGTSCAVRNANTQTKINESSQDKHGSTTMSNDPQDSDAVTLANLQFLKGFLDDNGNVRSKNQAQLTNPGHANKPPRYSARSLQKKDSRKGSSLNHPRKPSGISKPRGNEKRQERGAPIPGTHNNNLNPKNTHTHRAGKNRCIDRNVVEQVPSRGQIALLLNDGAYEQAMKFLDTKWLSNGHAAAGPPSNVQARPIPAAAPDAAKREVAGLWNDIGTAIPIVNNRRLNSCPTQSWAPPPAQHVASRPLETSDDSGPHYVQNPSFRAVSALMNDEVYDSAMRAFETLQSTAWRNASVKCRNGRQNAHKAQARSTETPSKRIGIPKSRKQVRRSSFFCESAGAGSTKPAARASHGIRTKPPSVDRTRSTPQAQSVRSRLHRPLVNNERYHPELQSASNFHATGIRATQPSLTYPTQPRHSHVPQALHLAPGMEAASTPYACLRSTTVGHPSASNGQHNIAFPAQSFIPCNTIATGQYAQSTNIPTTHFYHTVPHLSSFNTGHEPILQFNNTIPSTSAGTDRYVQNSQYLPVPNYQQPLHNVSAIAANQHYNRAIDTNLIPAYNATDSAQNAQTLQAASTTNYRWRQEYEQTVPNVTLPTVPAHIPLDRIAQMNQSATQHISSGNRLAWADQNKATANSPPPVPDLHAFLTNLQQSPQTTGSIPAAQTQQAANAYKPHQRG
ncbi:hypothetical protein BWQ96_08360 [Gracilariopsis chorda]|uniref:Uncharacterized protein n=1 Tax=Gracilariopsis chorda TaxID=448386 RepID=A0A2V3IIJ8_9FLOR|nr:hypothetical protein BWQ96_08359 [Gracilariopsis chorda]PXF41908.1 hypothetical protein BWQ96_08360 [Gracilariopsis chorda]|eukprot:PXF41907.1 hypothetical protein BWQ96_08359 [Gracilariopsis chorda]